MAAPFFSTPFQPYVYQSPQAAVIPFQILGGEAQIVQIMLKPQERVIAKPGSMCYMWHLAMGFGRSLTGIVFSNPGPHDGFVGIAAPSFSRILPVDLATFGGELLCQSDAFLCSINDVVVTNSVEPRVRNMIVGPECIPRQKLVGQGLAFIVAGGSVAQKNLDAGEVLVVDAASIVAMTNTIDMQVKYSGSMGRMMFGGDNGVTASLTGPGIVFIQSLPFFRLSQRIARSVSSPNMRENPKFFLQIAMVIFFAYVMVVSSLIYTDI